MKISPEKMRLVAACLVAAVVCCSLSCTLAEQTTDDATRKVDQADASPDAKQPNALVDFSLFQKSFHKSYGSALEAARRMKLFLARSMAVFNSVVRYFHKKTLSFKAINEFSDRSDEELKRMLTPLEKLETDFKAMQSVDMGWKSLFGFGKKNKQNDASTSGANNDAASSGGGSSPATSYRDTEDEEEEDEEAESWL